ncbi:autophagy-related protein 16 [Podospora didyma]|uniref:Autophagy-related protein 16 n=1 Tax=Podospora didyma TaxID=330526 RepID=A0AAE0KG90_9PEZI|nr:autophagy-related protein 16 [Podospora didyma]
MLFCPLNCVPLLISSFRFSIHHKNPHFSTSGAMSGWREEYLKGVRDADEQHNNPANRELIDACSELVDRVAALEAEKSALQSASEAAPHGPAIASRGTPPTGTTPDTAITAETPVIARLRLDLAEALRGRGQFQTRLQAAEDELVRLRAKTAAESKLIRELTSERRTLMTKIRDREEELRGKTKMVADAHDEMTVLNMELNMETKRRREKEAENKQLVDRYMRRVAQEADAMNKSNEPLFTKKR